MLLQKKKKKKILIFVAYGKIYIWDRNTSFQKFPVQQEIWPQLAQNPASRFCLPKTWLPDLFFAKWKFQIGVKKGAQGIKIVS